MTTRLAFPSPINRSFMQACWVVPDLNAAIEQWVGSARVGPFFYFEDVPFVNPLYRGKPCNDLDLSAAMAQAGELQIELVHQNDEHPSFITEVVPRGRSGLHHMSLYCADYDTDLESYLQAGHAVAFSCEMMGARTCWLDTVGSLGFMVELIEANPIADAVFGQFRSAAEHWDGVTDPIRTLG